MMLTSILSFTLSFAVQALADSASWLDRPLANWNRLAATVPKAVSVDETREALLKRCDLTLRPATANQRNLTAAGWTPFVQFDKPIVQRDVEIVHGMSHADQNCRPDRFNAFVFVGGRFAGTLSPELMSVGHDGIAGAVRLVPPDIVTADFARYTSTDSECCPSSHVTVRYRIERNGLQPLIVPLELRKTRGSNFPQGRRYVSR